MRASATIEPLDLSPSPHRDFTKLPGTVDRGRFVKEDSMMRALVPSHGPLIGGLSSKSVRDCRLSASAKAIARCVPPAGITGGNVADRDRSRDDTINYGHTDTVAARRRRNRNKSAANRAARTQQNDRKAAIVAELRRRGYAV